MSRIAKVGRGRADGAAPAWAPSMGAIPVPALPRTAGLSGLVAWLLVATGPPSVDAQIASGVAPLFTSHQALTITITADFTALRADRTASPERPATFMIEGADGRSVEVRGELQTRGAFRLDPRNCSFPPLRMDVVDSEARGTALEGQDNLKLVSSCQPGRDSWQELVIKEYLAYRTLAYLTDASFAVRLLRATFVDTGGGTEPDTRIAFAIEQDDALAERLGATVFDLEEGKNLPAIAFEPTSRMTNAVAQYMLGNTDWSDVAGHNVEILDRSGVALVVPYDFDFSGVVDAPYATSNPDYQLGSVRERYYRGWCENPLVTAQVLERFRGAREEVLDLWRADTLLSEATRSRAIRYLESFFDDIETDARAERRFLRDCRSITGPGAEATGRRLALSYRTGEASGHPSAFEEPAPERS